MEIVGNCSESSYISMKLRNPRQFYFSHAFRILERAKLPGIGRFNECFFCFCFDVCRKSWVNMCVETIWYFVSNTSICFRFRFWSKSPEVASSKLSRCNEQKMLNKSTLSLVGWNSNSHESVTLFFLWFQTLWLLLSAWWCNITRIICCPRKALRQTRKTTVEARMI